MKNLNEMKNLKVYDADPEKSFTKAKAQAAQTLNIRDISLLTIALRFWPFKIKDNVWECFEKCCKCYLWKKISIKMAYLMFTLRYFDVSGFLEVV